jgi:hypothetical protein
MLRVGFRCGVVAVANIHANHTVLHVLPTFYFGFISKPKSTPP